MKKLTITFLSSGLLMALIATPSQASTQPLEEERFEKNQQNTLKPPVFSGANNNFLEKKLSSTKKEINHKGNILNGLLIDKAHFLLNLSLDQEDLAKILQKQQQKNFMEDTNDLYCTRDKLQLKISLAEAILDKTDEEIQTVQNDINTLEADYLSMKEKKKGQNKKIL